MRAAGAISLAAVALSLATAVPAAAVSPPTGPSHCRAGRVHRTLQGFAGAFDRGDYAKLDEIFAPAPEFQWYFTDGRIGRVAKRRATLIPYFRRRHARGERLGVGSFRFTGNSPHYGNFEMTMRRRIPGVRRGRWERAPGKGAAVCREGATRLIVMSFGNEPGR